LDLKVFTKGRSFIVENGYTCDLLSVVIANAPKNTLWITVQRHINIVAVASLKEIGGIVITENLLPEKEVIKKSEEEKVWLLGTKHNSFKLSGELFRILNGEKIHG
jgi:hypothetical protein